MENLECVVERVTYQNSQNGWSVLRCVDSCKNPITIVGNLGCARVGTALSADGDWKTDTRYGRQFVVQKWIEKLPATVSGIEKYLGGGLIKGVGASDAKKIVDHFGVRTIEIIEKYPERLKEVKGIGAKKASNIAKGWMESIAAKETMMFLQQYDISPAFAMKLYRKYEGETISKVRDNPYQLADEMWGVGFKTADAMAQKLGFAMDNELRLNSGIVYVLGELANEGHVYAEKTQLIEKASELLQVPVKNAEEAIDKAISNRTVVLEEGAVYLPDFYYAEKEVASNLLMIRNTALPSDSCDVDIAKLESMLGVEYDEIQADGIRTALRSKCMVLTGGPGTGKTTTVKGIITAFQMNKLSVVLAAPTGRAAKRMTEATGKEASTIHRLLEYKPNEGFTRDEDNPLEGDVLIVDESSMIDLKLMASLTAAIPAKMRLVLVGDIDQLPSVGAGNVLRDIIDSGEIEVVRLTKIFRQAQESQIVMNAHRINHGELPCISNQKGTDFWFINIEREDIEDKEERTKAETQAAMEQIISLASDRLPRYCNVPASEVQVLTPMRKSLIGTDNLNVELQNALNPGGISLKQGSREFRIHDRVMQIKNNYDNDVFNGDIGTVTAIDLENKIVTVDFGGNHVVYEFADLPELVHAYACTIHKSQGSEYQVVVMPVSMMHFIMLQRNLIYTGVTRAKKMIVIVGTRKALRHAVGNLVVTKRNTRLKERLQGRL